MRAFLAKPLRNHRHVLLIVPLFAIMMTWPTFPRIFDGDEFWLHSSHRDEWYGFWDAWHLERVLTGQADYYFTDSLFHPEGASLAMHSMSLPHALLMAVLQKAMPADDAYKLLFLLMLCFNGFCSYLLIQQLIEDKWLALFGALVAVAATPFPHDSTPRDLMAWGTIPLSLYFLQRSIFEGRGRFAALAGMCAGITAFMSMYILVMNLMTVGIYSSFLALKAWRKRPFWRTLTVFCAVCCLFSFLRVYPMAAGSSLLEYRRQEKAERVRSVDVMMYFVHAGNPFTGDLIQELLQVPPGYNWRDGYIGYINVFFIACALLFCRRRGRLTPWITILLLFAVLRLGAYLTINGVKYKHIALPEAFLSEWLPYPFGFVNIQEYYSIGIALPLAIVSTFGLAALLRSKPTVIRIALVLLASAILAFEFYAPREGRGVVPEKTAYIDWLRSNAPSEIQLIHLPRHLPQYYLYLQTLGDYPHVLGKTGNVPLSAEVHVQSNLLLDAWWSRRRNIHCLHYNRQEYIAAVDRILESGSTYIIVHTWRWGAEFLMPSFGNIPAAYEDDFVSVYKLRDLRQSCENMRTINSTAPPPPRI
ncbi:MAG: hypothetical protein OXI30_07535 [Chloroflexota bacterium]|nr:hypothetical protein [Chloroflexota bacterium]